MKRIGLAALVIAAAVAAVLSLPRGAAQVEPRSPEAAVARIEPAAPAPIAPPKRDVVPLAVARMKARELAQGRQPPVAPIAAPPAATPPAPAAEAAADPKARAIEWMSARVKADDRMAPFLRAARQLELPANKQEQILALLASKSRVAPPADDSAPPPDPRESMRKRAEALRELMRPLASIAGADTGRLIAAAMRPDPADFPAPAQRRLARGRLR